MRIHYFILFVATVWLVCFAPWLTIFFWLSDIGGSAMFLASLVFLPVYIGVTIRSLRKGPDWLAFVTVQWLGISALGLLAMVPALVLSLFVSQTMAASVMVLLWISLALFATYRAHALCDVRREIQDARLDRNHKIVQISDVHIGSRSHRFLHRVIDSVNAHKPDFVLITGDLVDLTRVGARDLAALAELTCPAFMCIGNHERYVDLEKALTDIRAHGIEILRDQLHEHNGLQIIGIDDHDKPARVGEVLDGLAPKTNQYSIVLYHRPDGWHHVAERGLPLMLAGHTHNGQIWPFNWLVKYQFPQIAGWYEDRERGSAMHVSSGTGTWGPTFRLGSRCEITVLDLSPEVSP